jgi:glycosyltransferase involved in cell wall biosynthesis
MSPALTVAVLTFDEEENLPACLASLGGLECAVFVVDSGSTDRTVEIAESRGAQVLVHAFESHVKQWAWALGRLPEDTEWVLGLDADQRLSPELVQELKRLYTSAPEGLASFDGFYVNRRQMFRGCWIRHGGYYPKYLLKLFRATRVQLDERDLIDHHFYVVGKVGTLRGDLVEDNHKERDIAFWITKHLRYAPLHAREELARRTAADAWPIQPALFGSPDQRTVWLKQRWYRLPLYVRPLLYFVYRYVVLRGFVDGRQGFIFHFLQAFWYRLLVDIELDSLLARRREPALIERATAGGRPV